MVAQAGHDYALPEWSLMKVLSRILILLVLVVIVGGAVFLMTWDIPAPTHLIEKPLPNDKLPN